MGKGVKVDDIFKGAEALLRLAWSQRSVQVTDAAGRIIDRIDSVEAPSHWSQQAVTVVARQYLRRGLQRGGAETSVRALVTRVVSTIAKAGQERGYFASVGDAHRFESELSFLVLSQKASFNSPVWFNCGLWHVYGETGASGSWAWSEEAGRPIEVKNAFERPQASACYIQSVEDSLASIFDLLKNEARLFKYGSGTGTNFSAIRGAGEALGGGGVSSGLMSFLDVFDRAAGATKSGGTTRRAAKMVCLDVDHPEIFEFVRWKAKEESKAQVLIRAGFSSGMEGEAYRSVSGQNSNNSVRVTDRFLKAVQNDASWSTRPRLGGVGKQFPARELWRAIAESAWLCADPGVQYHDNIQRWNPCRSSGVIRASNPCSEFMFLDDTACNLASLNLKAFFNGPDFDVAGFEHAVRLLIIAQDILVDLASYPQYDIADRSHRFRPLGLGYANLGALLMGLGLPYGGETGRNQAAALTALMGALAYKVSGELAGVHGAFSEFAANRESMNEVIRNHRRAAERAAESETGQVDSERAQAQWRLAIKTWREAERYGSTVGFRNSQVTAIAPTGTIAFMMDCDTTGIEPDYALVKRKILAGGGVLTYWNHSVEEALKTIGYSGAEVESLVKTLEAAGDFAFLDRLPEAHREVFRCAQQLPADAHLLMMAAVQPYVSGAISKTINLPSTATTGDVAAVFERGATLGLKSVSIYRDKSKSVQPLSSAFAGGATSVPQNPVNSFETCSVCGHPTLVCGTCWVCPQCGHSLACS